MMLIFSSMMVLAFSMSIWITFIYNTGDFAPCINKSRTILYNSITERSTGWKTHYYGLMNKDLIDKAFGNLECIDFMTTYSKIGNAGITLFSLKGSEELHELKTIVSDENVWKEYKYDFIEGGPFTKEDRISGQKCVVISSSTAYEIFGSLENVINKRITLDSSGEEYSISGVIKDVYSNSRNAYSQVWMLEDYAYESLNKPYAGLHNVNIILKEGYSRKDLEDAVNSNLKTYSENIALPEGHNLSFITQVMYASAEDYFQLSLASLLILLIPGINSIGLVSSYMSKRASEIGVRKAYGASNKAVFLKLVNENFVTTTIGAVLGFGLGMMMIRVFLEMVNPFSVVPLKMFINIKIIIIAFILSLAFNLISILIPAYRASKSSICEILKGDN